MNAWMLVALASWRQPYTGERWGLSHEAYYAGLNLNISAPLCLPGSS